MIKNSSRLSILLHTFSSMNHGIYFLIYSGQFDRSYLSKFLNQHYSPWHLLCCSSFPLCPIHRNCIWNLWRNCSLISFIYRIFTEPFVVKTPFFHYIFGSQLNFFPTTFSRTKWYTTMILRLPRCLYFMKYRFINWITHFLSSSALIHNYYLRSFYIKTWYYLTSLPTLINWVTTPSSSRRS